MKRYDLELIDKYGCAEGSDLEENPDGDWILFDEAEKHFPAATIRKIAEAMTLDLEDPKERMERINLFADLEAAVTESDFSHTVDDIEEALWSLIGGKP